MSITAEQIDDLLTSTVESMVQAHKKESANTCDSMDKIKWDSNKKRVIIQEKTIFPSFS